MSTAALGLCWGAVGATTIEELIDAGVEGGFDAITVRPSLLRDAMERGVAPAELRRRLADGGIVVGSIDPLLSALPGAPATDAVPAAYRHLFSADADACFRAAEELGAPSVNVAHYLATAVEADRFATALGELAGRAGAHGLRLTIEFFPESPNVSNLEATLAVMDAVDAPNLYLMFDTLHFCRSGGVPSEVGGIPPERFGAVQVSDYPRIDAQHPYVGMSDRLLPGDGELPLTEIVGQIVAVRPDLCLDAEVFNRGLAALAPAEAARLVHASMDRLLATIDQP